MKIFLLVSIATVASGCTPFEDADMTDRNTFVHFFSSATDYVGLVAEVDQDGGFIVSGEIRKSDGSTDALMIKTSSRGHRVWERIIPNSVVRAIRPIENGYILLGDSIKTNPVSPEVNELVNSYARLMLMDSQGNITDQHVSTGKVRRSINNQVIDLTVDYFGNALNVDSEGNIIILGSYREPGERQSSFISAFDPSDLTDSLWYRSFAPTDDQDYINCNALHVASSNGLVWARRNFTQDNVTREFFTVAHVVPGSTFKDNSPFGENDSRNHSASDIRKSSVGFGVVGTYAEPNGLNGNIYFIRADAQGKLLKESVQYIDGDLLVRNNQILPAGSRDNSGSQDAGLALEAIGDGFIIGGTLTSTPTVGGGGTDILLIKLDPFGNLVWEKLIGGSGDETITSIRETPDKGLLLCGTNTVNGLSTIMLVKTDPQGNITD